MPEVTPPDQAARERIRRMLGRTLFVEAGAGSGKTTALVDRVVALVTDPDDPVELAAIAAITFTEKAGAELRDRIRQRLEERHRIAGEGAAGARIGEALGQLDGAAIGTLHAFAHRLLSEYPVEAGLPPRVEVLDEVSSAVAFDRRWSTFQEGLLADESLGRTILLLLASGIRFDKLRALAEAFDDNWDLVAERVPPAGEEPPRVDDLLAPVLATLVDLSREPCRDPDDRLGAGLREIGALAERLAGITDELELMEALRSVGEDRTPSFRVGRVGRRKAFDDIDGLRARIVEAGAALSAVSETVAQHCVRRLGSAIRSFTLSAAGERRAAGELEFHDLLVLARAVLCDPDTGPAVRRGLHRRYRRLLLDEFQDTDPIQVELAVRIAAEPDDTHRADGPWEAVRVAPGHLFFVGDPKQSIYRFRRADVELFLRAAGRFGAQGEEGEPVVRLTSNFRSVGPLLAWLNRSFPALMSPEGPDVVGPQVSYVPLDATVEGVPDGPVVSVLGRHPHDAGLRADDLRSAEAADVVSVIGTLMAEGWTVRDLRSGQWRPARLGDVTILVPARTSLPFLEDALQAAAIAYRAESSSLVYATRAVRDLLMVLRAVGDPTDHLRVVSALRTPLLGCGDDDLFRFFVERKGRWNYLAEQPGTVLAEDPVLSSLGYLRSLHQRQAWLSPAELLDRICVDRRAFELGFAERRPRDLWRRLRYVVDQARQWTEATGGHLRGYLQWLEIQASESSHLAESILPETDDDAVRIMTIHAAKGLEFPITILSGLSTRPASNRQSVRVVFPPAGGVGYKVGAQVATPEFSAVKPVDEQMEYDERVRLLYVAATRARDHLVVSLHRATRRTAAEGRSRTNAELLVAAMDGWLDELPDGNGESSVATPPPAVPSPPPPWDSWSAQRARALERATRPTAVAATALTDDGDPDRGAEPTEAAPASADDPGLHKRPRDLDLPPWLKGRYGTSVGRAVHGVLQTVDLGRGTGVDDAVAAQCEAEAIVGRAGEVRGLVDAALASDLVAEAAAAPHWREVYVCTPVGGRLLEGYIDLLYRGPGGLVVADYKTAATSDPARLDQRVAGYRLQGAAYALAVAATTGEPVDRVVFVFLTPQGAVERELADVDRAVEEVRGLVAAGREILTT